MARYSWMAPEPARMGALMDPAKIRMGRPQFRTPGSLGTLPPVGALAGSGSGTGSGGGSGAGSGAGEAAGEGSSDAGLIDDLLGGLIPSIPSSGGAEGPAGGTGSGVLDPPPPTTTGGGGGSVGDIDAPTGLNPLEQRALEETYSRILGGSVDSAELIDLMGSMDDAALDGLLEAIEKMAGVLPTPTDEQVAQIQANPTGTAEDLAQIMGSTGGGSTSGYAGATGPYGGIYGSGPYYGGGQQPIVSVYEGGSAGGPWLGVFPD